VFGDFGCLRSFGLLGVTVKGLKGLVVKVKGREFGVTVKGLRS